MKIPQTKVINLMILLFALFVSISCSKDTDLLADYVISDSKQARFIGNLLVDDTYFTGNDETLILDVLSNDVLSNPDKVKIVETSEPTNGTVIINEDKTLTYIPQSQSTTKEEDATTPDGTQGTGESVETPEDTVTDETESSQEKGAEQETEAAEENETIPETKPAPEKQTTQESNTLSSEKKEEEVSDTFTYTTETTDDDGSTTTEEAAVTVTTGYGELKAFPTAEGFGRNASGGRGGIVVEVTNLNDSGPGSFRAALKMKQRRTIVFKVGGTIQCRDLLRVPAESGNLTIAGQTAPGDGILVKGGELQIRASNVIVRHIRFRMGPNPPGKSNYDGIKIRSYDLSNPAKNIIIDHCSVSWGDDENISIKNAENVTIQNSILGECHKSFLMQRAKNISVLNNLFSLTASRNILANTVKHLDLTFEQINNIVYGFKWGTSGTDGMSFNVINNVYKLSNDFETSTRWCITNTPPNPENKDDATIETTHAYIEGNVIDTKDLSLYRSELNGYVFPTPKYTSSYKPTDASSNRLDSKLLPHIGASIPVRDAVDTRLIESYLTSTGTVKDYGTYPNIEGGIGYVDSDKDGIADDWEKSNGLNPDDYSDGARDRNGDGYTNLEDFLYYLTL